MDVVSHGLWSYVGARAVTIRNARLRLRPFVATAFGMLPDIIAFAPLTIWSAVQFINGKSHLAGHRAAEEYIARNVPWLQTLTTQLYGASHSLIVWLVVFGVLLLFRVWWREWLAWLLHILVDIPTHSRESYPTPALWPLSDWTFDGATWRSAAILIPNFILLAIALLAVIRVSVVQARSRRHTEPPSR